MEMMTAYNPTNAKRIVVRILWRNWRISMENLYKWPVLYSLTGSAAIRCGET